MCHRQRKSGNSLASRDVLLSGSMLTPTRSAGRGGKGDEYITFPDTVVCGAFIKFHLVCGSNIRFQVPELDHRSRLTKGRDPEPRPNHQSQQVVIKSGSLHTLPIKGAPNALRERIF